MRAVVLGNKDLAVETLDLLESRGVSVAGVVLNPDDDGVEQGRWYRSLKAAALRRGLAILQPRNVSSPEGRAFIAECAPDLLLSLSYSRIIRRSILDLARLLPLNVHFSRLPRYRGCLPLVYALAHGERCAGATLHVMDEGIDTGDIIDQEDVPIGESDTAFTLYFRCVRAALAMLERTLPALLDRSYRRCPQDHALSSYHPQVYPNDRWLRPTMTVREFSCFVRAHTFPPYPSARARVAGREWEVLFREGQFEVPGLGIGPGSAGQVLEALQARHWEVPCPTSSTAN